MTDLTPAVIAEGERRAKAREDAWVRFLNDDSDESTYTQACDAFGTWAAENFAALITAARAAARYREALELIWPFFEGEHFYDHPDSVKVRKILADLAGEREGE